MLRSNGSATIAFLLGCWLTSAVEPAAAFNVYKVDPDCVAFGAYATVQAAIDAAASNPGEDYVWISNDNGTRTYSGQHITVNDADGVIIEGGFSDCNDFDPGVAYTTINGSGNGGVPVFDISGGYVYLGNLIIEGGDHGSGVNGGGISFLGHWRSRHRAGLHLSQSCRQRWRNQRQRHRCPARLGQIAARYDDLPQWGL
jgi:hypothetical protein